MPAICRVLFRQGDCRDTVETIEPEPFCGTHPAEGSPQTRLLRRLEAAILRELEKFILEIGVGFAFIGRQYRITIDGEVDELRELIRTPRSGIAQSVNSALVVMYWQIGTRIRTEVLKN